MAVFKPGRTPDELEVRFRAPFLLVFNVCATALSLLLCVVSLVLRGPSNAGFYGTLPLLIIFPVSALLVRKNDYGKASNLTCVTFSIVIFFALMAQGYSRPFILDQYAGFLIMSLIITVLFISDSRFVYASSLLTLTGFAVLLLRVGVFNRIPEGDPVLLSQSYASSFILVFCTGSMMLIRRIFDEMLKTVRIQLTESRSREEKGKELLVASKENLEQTRSVTDHTSETLSSSIEIEKNVISIRDRVKDAETRFASSGRALAEILASMDVLASGADEQAARVTETVASIERMTANIGNIASIVGGNREASRLLGESTHAGHENMMKTMNTFNVLRGYTENIRETTESINNIAARTNLLAMNAAIEAAHAGSSGKGFAVVANEIRSLAATSVSSARKITDDLNRLLTDIRLTGEALERSDAVFLRIEGEILNTSRAMDDILSGLREADSGIGRILESTEVLNRVTLSVNDRVKQVRSSHDILRTETGYVSDVMSEISCNMDEIKQGANNIRTSMETVACGNSRLVEMYERLDRELASV